MNLISVLSLLCFFVADTFLLICGRPGFGSLRRCSHSLRRDFRLQEQQQVIAAAGLRVSARHVEAAKRMHADQSTSALTVEIEIADVKLSARAVEFRFIGAVNRARQTKLRVVCDPE